MLSDCCAGFFSKARPRGGGGGNGAAVHLHRLRIGLCVSSCICVHFPLIHTDGPSGCPVLAGVVNRGGISTPILYEQ